MQLLLLAAKRQGVRGCRSTRQRRRCQSLSGRCQPSLAGASAGDAVCGAELRNWVREMIWVLRKALERCSWDRGEFFLLCSMAQPLTQLHREGRMGDPHGVQGQDQGTGLGEPLRTLKLHPKKLHQPKALALLREQFWCEEEAAGFSVAEDIVQHQLWSGLL